MKATLTTLLFLLLPLCAAAQYEWHPIRPGWHYHYSHNGDTGIAAVRYTVWAWQYDDTTDADTVRMSLPLRYHSAFQVVVVTPSTTPFNSKVKVWQNDSVWAFVNTSWAIHEETTPWTLYPFAPVGFSWPIAAGLSAQVVSVYDSLIWGVPDSVKRILVSNGLSILLSKSFGILSVPEKVDSIGSKLATLVGVEEPGAGLMWPTRNDFFSFTPGTVVTYRVGHGNFNIMLDGHPLDIGPFLSLEEPVIDSVVTFTVDSVTSTLESNGSIVYHVHAAGLDQIGSDLFFPIRYNYEIPGFANQRFGYQQGALPSFGYDTLGNIFASSGHGFRPVPFLASSYYDSLDASRNMITEPSGANFIFNIPMFSTVWELCYTTGLGCTFSRVYSIQSDVFPHEPYQFAEMIAYERPAVSVTENANSEIPEVAIYPNPAESFVFVSGLPQQGISFQIQAVTGEIVKSGTAHGGISVSDIPSGVYILFLSNFESSRVYVKRLVVNH